LKQLNDILTGVDTLKLIGNVNRPVNTIIFDSRKVGSDATFVALKGTKTDGHQYITKAITAGASTIICEQLPETLEADVTYIQVASSNEALGLLAANFHDNPSDQLSLIGVTGTNGKTTTVTLLHQLFTELGYNVGLLSTVENKIGNRVVPANYTTPYPMELNGLLAEMVDAGCEFAFMEVSSHAVAQRRIAGLRFAGGVFSNLTQDHLDYHKTFKEYIYAKKRFFDDLPAEAFSLINTDDRNGKVMVQNSKSKIITYGLRTMADYKVKIIENRLSGLVMQLDGHEFYSRLIGEFNAYNLLAVYTTAVLLEEDPKDVLVALSKLNAVEGRFEYLVNKKRDIIGIVDYSHTPDALEKVLNTIETLRTGSERVITVVGCGGDRDKTKRPIMARVACDLSNQVILTSDNPRTEDPETIIREMETGVAITAKSKVLSITNREQAIKAACQMANNGDIILIAGKGHEKYQEINGVKHPFDDKEVLKENLMN